MMTSSQKFSKLKKIYKTTTDVQKKFCIAFQNKRQTISIQYLSLPRDYGVLYNRSKDFLPEKFDSSLITFL